MSRSRTPMSLKGLPGTERYDYRTELDATNFSTVHLYFDRDADRTTVVKIAEHPRGTPAGESVWREGKIMDRIRHAAIPHLYWLREWNGRAVFAMPHYTGGTLRTAASSGRLGAAAVIDVGIQLAGALDATHSAGFVHADVKPNNVLLVERGSTAVVLIDFGIAAPLDSGDITLTQEVGLPAPGVRPQSVGWAPPEVIDAHAGWVADPRSDVFSLSATLYAILLNGRSPFQDESVNVPQAEVERRIRAGEPRALNRSDVPSDFLDLLRAGLAPALADRPDAAEFGAIMATLTADAATTESQVVSIVFGEGEREGDTTTRMATTVGGAEAPTETGLRDEREPRRPRRPARRPRLRVIVGAAVLTVLAALVVVSLIISTPPELTDAEETPSVDVVDTPSIVPAPALVDARRDGASVVVEWGNPSPVDGDSFVWQRTDGAATDDRPRPTDDTELTIDQAEGTTVCVEISILRDGQLSAEPLEVCVP